MMLRKEVLLDLQRLIMYKETFYSCNYVHVRMVAAYIAIAT